MSVGNGPKVRARPFSVSVVSLTLFRVHVGCDEYQVNRLTGLKSSLGLTSFKPALALGVVEAL